MEEMIEMVREKTSKDKMPRPQDAKEFIKDLIDELEAIIEGLNIDIDREN